MVAERLAEVARALYAEVFDLARGLDRAESGLPAGSYVSKVVSGRRYWYLQSSGGGIRTQRYLGPESAELLAQKREVEARRRDLEPDRERLARLNDALIASGAVAETAAGARVIGLLATAGLFRAGAVLVGTRAFGVLANALGLRASALARTQDVDLAVSGALALVLPREGDRNLAAILAETEPPFLAVPAMGRRDPSTSFKVRGREIRVDFLTPLVGRERERPVVLGASGVAAWSLRLLDFVLEGAIEAVLIGSKPVVVRVPDPARFALHKLWLARRRGAAEATRARKDRDQAAALIEILLEDRPRDLSRAARALAARPAAFATVRAEARRLPGGLAAEAARLLAR